IWKDRSALPQVAVDLNFRLAPGKEPERDGLPLAELQCRKLHVLLIVVCAGARLGIRHHQILPLSACIEVRWIHFGDCGADHRSRVELDSERVDEVLSSDGQPPGVADPDDLLTGLVDDLATKRYADVRT